MTEAIYRVRNEIASPFILALGQGFMEGLAMTVEEDAMTVKVGSLKG